MVKNIADRLIWLPLALEASFWWLTGPIAGTGLLSRLRTAPTSTVSSPRQLQSACMSVESHFAKKDPSVLATYRRVLDVARALGPVAEEAKKTSIHLVRDTAFAGVATRLSSLVLTLKSASDIRSPRVEKREQTSANRWHVEVRLTAPAQVDRQLTAWLRAAYELAGP
jgi:hypothetical protein